MTNDKKLRFVLHEHYASSHHFDLRLEERGVLRSWAVPKGMPTHPEQNRLAVEVEDHDLDHIDFEDHTAVDARRAAEPGAVVKSIWDRGHYEVVRASPTKLVIDMHGQRLQGRYSLFQTGGTQWMIHLMDS